MPHRLTCVAILLFWAVAAVALVTRDLLPEMLIGTPPDLRSIARAEAEADPGPTRWAIMVRDPDHPEAEPRSVGQAKTRTQVKADGWVQMHGDVTLDAAGLLENTPFATSGDNRFAISSSYEVDPSGNLFGFRAGVRAAEDQVDLLTLEGRVDEDKLIVRAHSSVGLFSWNRTFPYEPRGMVQNALGPMDRMPGLQVGQRWESRIVSPLTGMVEVVRIEVARKTAITWGGGPVVTLEVVTRSGPFPIRIWVRPDGLVLRQEIANPFGTLVLERLAREDSSPASPADESGGEAR